MPDDLQSRNLVLAKVNLDGGITQRRYALPSRNLVIERIPLDGRFTSRVYSHASRDLVLQRVALGGTIQGSVDFPEIVPSQVQFKPPSHAVTEYVMQSGEVETHLWADSHSDASLELEYNNIRDSAADKILDTWDQASTYARNLQLPLKMLTGINSDLASYMLRGGLNARWFFAETPTWEVTVKGYGNLKVSIVSRCVTTSSVVGGNTPFPAVPVAPDSTASFNDCDFIGRDPDLELFIPPSWVRQRRSMANVLETVSTPDDNGNVYVLSTHNPAGVVYAVLTKFSTAGQQIWSKAINRTSGFPMVTLDIHRGGEGMRGLAVGPQGVVVVISARGVGAFGPSPDSHVLMCLSRATGEVRWARTFRSGTPDGFHDVLRVWTSSVTGDTFVIERLYGGGNSNGGLALSVFDNEGALKARWNMGLFTNGSLENIFHEVARPVMRPDGSFFIIGQRSQFSVAFRFVFLLSADGLSFLQPVYYNYGTYFSVTGFLLADGRLAIGSSGANTHIFNSSATALLSQVGNAVPAFGNVRVGFDGNYYMLSSNAFQSATLEVVSSNFLQRLSTRTVLLGVTPELPFQHGAGDFNHAPNVSRYVISAGNRFGDGMAYGVMSFEMYNTAYQYPTTPNYPLFSNRNTLAMFNIFSTTPTAIPVPGTAPPTWTSHAIDPLPLTSNPSPLIEGVLADYTSSVTIEDDTTTIWDFYSSP